MRIGKKATITEEDYLNAKDTIAQVELEKNILQESNQSQLYNAHIMLPGTFGELLIDLKRRNSEINNQIKEIKKNYLKQFNYSEEYLTIMEECIILIEMKYQNLDQKEELESKINNLDKKLQPFISEIDELISRKSAHIYLYHYIEQLEQKEKIATKIITEYEKQNHSNLKDKKHYKIV